MKCPYCQHSEDKVIDSRPVEDGAATRRRRECLACGRRFTTYEKIENLPLIVIKKDGSRQPFDREKLINGIMKSCEKRPVTTAQIESVVDTIENQAVNTMRREISSRELGELVMEHLKRVDEVAYVRFASVYRDFTDVYSFLEELKSMNISFSPVLPEKTLAPSDTAAAADETGAAAVQGAAVVTVRETAAAAAHERASAVMATETAGDSERVSK